ncbi:uncharacterized protein BO80DRAFT_435526 [Aspergillus ibericus CBS 121593]|uniref:Uncharacterized protein n=1 Tax=Aspergillus ibericus CBS 121593 TaxID=1448316 RepID=A0A395GYK0_9EURO|nr:hypothetical protein BO80DRAFT_435526 [Aspergillus ibericus CBS 121593]RAL00149.1 hypothetical protein BO80DRAFT_435526 [Aspergillus ibericus CBS 121593]
MIPSPAHPTQTSPVLCVAMLLARYFIIMRRIVLAGMFLVRSEDPTETMGHIPGYRNLQDWNTDQTSCFQAQSSRHAWRPNRTAGLARQTQAGIEDEGRGGV